MVLHDLMSDRGRSGEGLALLLADGALWDVRLRPESLFLAARIWNELDEDGAGTLVAAILDGPPPAGHQDEAGRRDREIGLRLMALEREGRPLPSSGAEALGGIRARHPGPALSAESREFFPVWLTVGSPARTAASKSELLAMPIRELEAWLRASAGRDGQGLDNWREAIAEKPGRGVAALRSLKAAAQQAGHPERRRNCLAPPPVR